jgi:hypothetical protein
VIALVQRPVVAAVQEYQQWRTRAIRHVHGREIVVCLGGDQWRIRLSVGQILEILDRTARASAESAAQRAMCTGFSGTFARLLYCCA